MLVLPECLTADLQHTTHTPGPMYFVCAVLGIVINGLGVLVLGDHGHSHGGVACNSNHSAHAAAQPSLSQMEVFC